MAVCKNVAGLLQQLSSVACHQKRSDKLGDGLRFLPLQNETDRYLTCENVLVLINCLGIRTPTNND
jgi:hypothetical protein